MRVKKIGSKVVILNKIRNNDIDQSLFYAWEELPKNIQTDFTAWCRKYMQVSHAQCFGGWAFGWSKYHEGYIDFLTNKEKFLKEIGR